VRVIEHTLIPLKDGTTLAARIWLPEDAEQNPVPAILEYLPYRKRDGTYERDALTHPYLAGHGYAGVRVGWRYAMAAEGLITLRSNYGPKETMDRLEAEVKAKGLTVFAHVDHAEGAAAVGLPLRPTDLLIFGNARGGTPLMQSVQTMGVDLPLKILVWQDEAGNTWLSYNDPSWLAKRHGTGRDTEATIAALSGALQALAKGAAGSP
jgi:uncharacterized protein (DUF302 family)